MVGYLSMSEAARRSNLSSKTLQRAIAKGDLKEAPRLQENYARIAVEELDRYLAARSGSKDVVQQSGQDLETRVLQLAEAVLHLQEEQQNARLLNGPDLLALVPIDEAHYESRFDAIEKRIATLGERLDGRIDELQKLLLQAQGIILHEQKMNEGLRKRLTALEMSVSTSGQTPKLQETSTEEPGHVQTYEGEWTITDSEEVVRYHYRDSKRARERLDIVMRNKPKEGWVLHPPVYFPSSASATEITEGLTHMYKQVIFKSGEVLVFVHDFNEILPAYQCEGTHKDVYANLTMLPYKGSTGTYTMSQTKCGKVKQTGHEGPAQTLRANKLLATLIDRVRKEMVLSGWIEDGQTDDVYPQPLWRKDV